ncbi:MAG: hypothetical protein RLZZ502_17 [Pseudomonadota bacterium]|jgi:hypothetical protein
MKFKQLLILTALGVMATTTAKAGELEIFEYENFQGMSTVIRGSIDNYEFKGRSIRVRGTAWDVCTGAYFSGVCSSYRPGEYPRTPSDIFNSAREQFAPPPPAPVSAPLVPGRIELYDNPGFRGISLVSDRSVPTLRGVNFANRAMSVIVAAGIWEVCTRDSFAGRCQTFPPGRYNELHPDLARNINSLRQIPPPAIPLPETAAAVVNPVAVIAGAVLGAAGVGVIPPASAPVVNTIQNGRLTFYSGPGFTGRSFSLVSDLADFGGTGFNDRAQSVQVESGTWELCQHGSYGGECRIFAPGQYPILYSLDNAISSARLIQAPARGHVQQGVNDGVFPNGARNTRHAVMIFADVDFRGESYRANTDVFTLGGTSMNDRSRSILVSYGKWQFCEDRDFRGRCVTLGPGSYPRLNWELDGKISSLRRVE